jgi:hypothetical protein
VLSFPDRDQPLDGQSWRSTCGPLAPEARAHDLVRPSCELNLLPRAVRQPPGAFVRVSHASPPIGGTTIVMASAVMLSMARPAT